MTTEKAIIAIAIIAGVTALIRFIPFAVFAGRETPRWISYLGRVLPYAIMGMLVVYCLKDMSFTSLSGFLPYTIASAVVVVLHVIFKNSLISIIGGTVCYMLLVQLVFV